MKKTINVCDRCGLECPYEPIDVIVGQTMTERQHMPTHEYQDIVESVDLCPLCMRARMDEMIQAMTQLQRAAWVEASRKKLEVRR